MKSMVTIKLKKKDKLSLESLVKRGSNKARVFTRAQALLQSHGGKTPTEICESLGIKALRTVQNIKERYLSGGLDMALYDRPRPGAPTKFEGKHRAELTALACTEAPEGHSQWSLSLLADKAVELNIVEEISPAHFGRILKKTKSNLTKKDSGA